MLTGKQRSYLKSLAHHKKPVAQVGKAGITEAFIAEMDRILESHELIKLNVLESNDLSADDAADALCEALGAEFVQSIGNKISIYRPRKKDPEIVLPR